MHYPLITGKETHGLPHDPFKALISPRPIGWITAMSLKGELNLAPYSFFNAFSDRPHIVGFSSAGKKDALTFIEETGEFTCSMVSYDLRDAMNATSAPLPRGNSEADYAGLAMAASKFVKPPRVAKAPAALECKYLQTIPMTSLEGVTEYYLILGQVVGIFIDDVYVKNGIVDAASMELIARGGYDNYYKTDENNKFAIGRPKGAGGFNG
jgi:flavin reductase (DIM6/NTAB) family NADH-FMN oxidoreductase RutF